MKISGTGNPTTRLNEITADDIATLRNYIIGFDSGVIKGFEETATDISVTLTSGIMFAYGYVGYEDTKTFYFNKTSATQYHFIYGEIDRSVIPNTFELKVKNNQGGSEIKPTTFRQDILSQVKTGVFQLPLYRVKLGSDGIEGEVKDLRYELNLMKYSIKKTFHADITTEKIVKEISGSALAKTQLTSDYSKKIATTLFVHNACRNYIDNGGEVIGYTMTIYCLDDLGEEGSVTFNPNPVILSETHPTVTVRANVLLGYSIISYTKTGNFTVTRNGNNFVLSLGDYVLTQDETGYLHVDSEED